MRAATPSLNQDRSSEMTQTFEDAGRFGKDLMDNGLRSLTSLSKGLQAFAVETGESTEKSYEAGSAALERLVSAKSLEAAFAVQSDYARQSYESFIQEASRLGELYAEVARDAYKPFEAVAAAPR